MRYLTVGADYQGTGLKDDFTGTIEPTTLSLPSELIHRISKWVADYQSIIPLDEGERLGRKEEIQDLDKRGLVIARDLKAYLGEAVKVQYYSEGELTRLPI